MSSVIVRQQKRRSPPRQPLDRHLSEDNACDGTTYINAGIDSTCSKKYSRTIYKLTGGIALPTVTSPTASTKMGNNNRQNDDVIPMLLNNRIQEERFDLINNGCCVHCDSYSMMNTIPNEQILNEEYISSRDEYQHYPSTNSSSRHSTPNSSGAEKQFQFGNNYNIERGSGQNSRTSSVAESITVNPEGFTNYSEVIQHLQAVWNNQNTINEGSRRTATTSSTGSTSINDSNTNETISSNYSKGHSQQQQQQHYNSHQHNNQYSGQYWSNYNNPRRSGNSGNYSRGYNSGNNDNYWNQKSNRFPSHRSMNNLMTNSSNYQQQSQPSPPTQRRQGDIQQQQHHNEQQPSQSYYKKNRSEYDRRPNGYHSQQQQQQQQSSDYSSINHQQPPNNSAQNFTSTSSEQSNISSTQSYPNNLNSYNR